MWGGWGVSSSFFCAQIGAGAVRYFTPTEVEIDGFNFVTRPRSYFSGSIMGRNPVLLLLLLGRFIARYRGARSLASTFFATGPRFWRRLIPPRFLQKTCRWAARLRPSKVEFRRHPLGNLDPILPTIGRVGSPHRPSSVEFPLIHLPSFPILEWAGVTLMRANLLLSRPCRRH